MPHAVSTLDEDLWFGEVFVGPVHPQAKGITLVVGPTEALTPKILSSSRAVTLSVRTLLALGPKG
jgi:hypothetical protein